MFQLLQHTVTQQADRRPGAVAIVDRGERTTYEQLDGLSNQIARLLIDGGCREGDRVALYMPKSAMAIAALLGIYKAGAVYVPLDPSSPPGRLQKILDSCDSGWLLAGNVPAPVVDGLFQARPDMSLGWVGAGTLEGEHVRARFTLDDLSRAPLSSVPCVRGPEDAAHILFTSGSTGMPKGVVITHANVLRFVEWAVAYFRMAPADRVSAHPPLHFDLSFFDMFGTFAAGAELHLVPPELTLLPNTLAEMIRISQLTQWFSVPSVLSYLAQFDVVQPDDFPSLRRVLWCGEVLPTPCLMYWMRRLPHVEFTNLYGPTEATIASSYYTVPVCPVDPQTPIPIGRPCDGEELLVLDERLQPAAQGSVGELYIAGAGLSPGYWRDADRTVAAFLPHPRRPGERVYRTGDLARSDDEGLVYFVGRTDSQIKSRGYRIELGEIEAALHTVAGIREGVVVAVSSGGFEGHAICCAYVPIEGSDTGAAAIRRQLSRLVPAYMLPSRWMALERFPRNANGKIDRPQIRKAFESDAACVA